MAKDKICNDCIHHKNGWCKARKTNKGLKDLLECQLKKTDNLLALEQYLEQKQFELNIDNNSYNRGVVKGLEIALAIIKK